MLLSTPGLVLHTTPYAETSVVVKVFTRLLGVQSYLVKGVRGRGGRMKQNLFEPLRSLDMVVYDSHHGELNYIRELTPRHPDQSSDAVGNALRFFMTEVLYKSLHDDDPLPELWDYVESLQTMGQEQPAMARRDVPISFLLTVARHLGIEPLDNHSPHMPYFDLQEGSFVSAASETTLPLELSSALHEYLQLALHTLPAPFTPSQSLRSRSDLINALIAYYQLHLSGFRNFHSHEILHTILN